MRLAMEDENEDDTIFIDDGEEVEVVEDDGFLSVMTPRVQGPLLPASQSDFRDHVADMDMTINSWQEMEKLHNRINILMTENADIKSERDAKVMAIEGLVAARERLHREKNALTEEVERLKEQVVKMAPTTKDARPGTSTDAHHTEVLMPSLLRDTEPPRRHSISGATPSDAQQYRGIVISLDDAFLGKADDARPGEVLEAFVGAVDQQVESCLSVMDTDGPAEKEQFFRDKCLYIKVDVVNLSCFLSALKRINNLASSIAPVAAIDSNTVSARASEEDYADADFLLSVGSTPTMPLLSIDHQEGPHSVSTPDLLLTHDGRPVEDVDLPDEDEAIVDMFHELLKDLLTEVCQAGEDNASEDHTSQQVSSGTVGASRSYSPSGGARGPACTTSGEYYSAEGVAESMGAGHRVASMPIITPSVSLYAEQAPVPSQHTVNQRPAELTVEPLPEVYADTLVHVPSDTLPEISPWAHGSTTSSSVLMPAQDGSSDLTVSQRQRPRRPFDLPSSRLVDILQAHRITPFSRTSIVTRQSISNPALPVDRSLQEARVWEQDQMEDLFVEAQLENNKLLEQNRGLMRALEVLAQEHRALKEYVCQQAKPDEGGMGWRGYWNMTVAFILHTLLTINLRLISGM